MISDPNGGGLTAEVAHRLAAILGERWQVVATTARDDTLLSIRVVGDGTRGNVRLEPASGSAQWWLDHYDPNGAPSAWCDYDPQRSCGADELATLILGTSRQASPRSSSRICS